MQLTFFESLINVILVSEPMHLLEKFKPDLRGLFVAWAC